MSYSGVPLKLGNGVLHIDVCRKHKVKTVKSGSGGAVGAGVSSNSSVSTGCGSGVTSGVSTGGSSVIHSVLFAVFASISTSMDYLDLVCESLLVCAQRYTLIIASLGPLQTIEWHW